MYLGLDLGTTNIKALVVEEGGRIVAEGTAPVERFCTADGGVEQDLEQIWTATVTAVKNAMRELNPARIRAIGASSQGGALQLFDPFDKPLGRVISWLDTRGESADAELTAELGAEFFARHIGYGASGVPIGQILRLRRQFPELIRWPNRIGFVGDAIVGRLCGRRGHDVTSLGIAMLYNPWLERPDPELLARLGLREEQLPCLLPATTAAGMLQDQAAETIGLPPGIPVSPAIHDQYAASLGAASVAEGDVNFSAGTAWVLLANTGKLAPPVVREACVCAHPVAGLYGQMLSLNNGGSAINWVLSLFGDEPATTERIDSALDAAPPGSDGLRFWPFLSGGPDLGGGVPIRGRLSGITLAHTRDHLLRAVIEGLACELLRHIRLLTAAGFPVNRLTLCGSAAAGRNTPQVIADVANLPVACIEACDVSAFGAAVIARKLVDSRADLASIARQWAPSGRTVQPSELAPAFRDLLRDYFALFDGSTI
jgi:sugar (pentulose or hexulose) kinase